MRARTLKWGWGGPNFARSVGPLLWVCPWEAQEGHTLLAMGAARLQFEMLQSLPSHLARGIAKFSTS